MQSYQKSLPPSFVRTWKQGANHDRHIRRRRTATNHPEDQSMSSNLFPLTGALLFAGLFAGLSAISSHYCGDLTVGDALGIEPPAIAAPIAADAIPTIAGPDETPAGKPTWFAVTGISSSASAAFLPTALLDTDPSRVVQGNALFWVAQPGEYVLTAIVVDWDAKRFTPLSKQVTVTGDLKPNPPVPPTPDPTPVPGERFVLIVSETQDRTPQEAATLAALRRWLTDRGVDWRIIDPTTEAAWMEPHAAKLREAGVKGAALLVYAPASDSHPGAYLAVEPLPGRSQEAIARIEEALK